MSLALWLALACTAPADPPVPDACDVEPTGQVHLPADEALHTEPVEWWYWTGHLQDEQQRWYGFEQTFFVVQTGLVDNTISHTALLDVAADTFQADERVAGVPASMPANAFALEVDGDTANGSGGEDHLVGRAGDTSWTLDLSAQKPAVFQHGDGYHDYDVGGYTWYYSRERMAVTGSVTIGGEARTVTGSAWMDHQWGHLVQATQSGWDWFALQLDDDREIMLFLARGGGEVVGGSISGADCVSEELAADEIHMVALGEWTSPVTDCVYPQGWELTVRGETFTVTPVRQDQEVVNDLKTYWEGASLVSGAATGRAYVELAGYCN